MKIAACQLPEIRSDVPAAVAVVREYARRATARGASIVCFPECFLQGYETHPAQAAAVALDLQSTDFARILRAVDEIKTVIVVGLIEREGEVLYNTAVAIAHGEVVGRYRKAHLLRAEESVFSAGEHPVVFDVDGNKVGMNICYDLNFADAARLNAEAGAEVLVCPCSNMMPRTLAEDWKNRHNEIRANRARESGLWIVSSDIVGERGDSISYGPTAVIDPTGTVVDQVPLLTTGMVVVEIERDMPVLGRES